MTSETGKENYISIGVNQSLFYEIIGCKVQLVQIRVIGDTNPRS